MNSRHRKTLEAIFANPVNGNLPWEQIEALLVALGCRLIEGKGAPVTVEKDGVKAYFHRPHPRRESFKYRVRDAREFLSKIGVQP